MKAALCPLLLLTLCTLPAAAAVRHTGHVSVQPGGTYTMREGDIELAEGATLRLVSPADTSTTTHYSGHISGPGNLVVESDSEKAAFHLSDEPEALSIDIRSGRLILSNAVTSSHIFIAPGATLSLQHSGRELLTLRSNTQKAELLFADIKPTSPTEVTIGDYGPISSRLRHLALHPASGSTLTLVNTSIRPDSTLSANGATLRLLGSVIFLGSAPAQQSAAKGVPTYTCTSLQGKLTLTTPQLMLDLSAIKPAPGPLRVQFAPGVQLQNIGSIQATLGRGTTIPGTIRTGEPNAIYFNIPNQVDRRVTSYDRQVKD